jgi:molecular chaperone DnaK (HSP70)
MSTIVGIDLGTTKSVVGAWINGKPVIIPDRNGRLSIPSEILIQGDLDHQEVLQVGIVEQKTNIIIIVLLFMPLNSGWVAR